MKERKDKPRIPLRMKELGAVLFFYFFFSLIYHIVLWYNAGESAKSWSSWIDLDYYWQTAGMQYLFYLAASVVIWLLGVKLLRRFSSFVQIIAVFFLVSISVFLVKDLRYSILDAFKYGHLQGYGSVWDVYIPWLFMCIQFGFYFAYRYFKDNQEQLKLKAELRQAALNSEISAIKAQLNPHFLYNVFNTINASLPPENEKTRNMIGQLSDLFRYQLQVSKEDLVSVKSELEFTEKYLELEKARFEERLNFNIVVDNELLEMKIPPMLLQPIVENSIKHGISNKINGGAIEIRVQKSMGKIKFSVLDTGVGVTDKTTILEKGVGLKNTAFRLKKICDSEIQFSDNMPSGFIVEFSI